MPICSAKSDCLFRVTECLGEYKNYEYQMGRHLTRDDIEELINSLSILINNPEFINIKMNKEFYNKIVEFSRFISQNTFNLALHKQEQILLLEPTSNSSLLDFVNIAIINSLNKQKELLFRS